MPTPPGPVAAASLLAPPAAAGSPEPAAWWIQLAAERPFAGEALVLVAIVGIGLLSALFGRRLGCPPAVRSRTFPGRTPEEVFEDVEARLADLGIPTSFREPGIRLQAVEDQGEGRYRRLPKEVEVRLFAEPEGVRAEVTVAYQAMILVDSGEGAYAEDLADRILGTERPLRIETVLPLSLFMAFSANLVAAALVVLTLRLVPASLLGFASAAQAALLAAVVLSILAVLQTLPRAGRAGRLPALLLLAIGAGQTIYWLGRYLFFF